MYASSDSRLSQYSCGYFIILAISYHPRVHAFWPRRIWRLFGWLHDIEHMTTRGGFTYLMIAFRASMSWPTCSQIIGVDIR